MLASSRALYPFINHHNMIVQLSKESLKFPMNEPCLANYLLAIPIQVHREVVPAIECRHPILGLATILLKLFQRLSTLAFDGLPDLLTARRDAAFEWLRSHVEAVPAWLLLTHGNFNISWRDPVRY